MLFMRTVGGELWLCIWRGGVGSALGRSLDAAFKRGSEGSRDRELRDGEGVVGECEPVGDGGEV
jgi:hypothetical protein